MYIIYETKLLIAIAFDHAVNHDSLVRSSVYHITTIDNKYVFISDNIWSYIEPDFITKQS